VPSFQTLFRPELEPAIGTLLETVLGHRRARDVAAEPLELLSVASIDALPRVQVDAAHLRGARRPLDRAWLRVAEVDSPGSGASAFAAAPRASRPLSSRSPRGTARPVAGSSGRFFIGSRRSPRDASSRAEREAVRAFEGTSQAFCLAPRAKSARGGQDGAASR
jgi:hypothetical protein